MKLSAVILTYNNFLGLKDIIENLYHQTRNPEEIVVIDNASEDETIKIKEIFPEIKYVRVEENTGSGGGYHQGFKIGLQNSDFVFVTDDDVLYPSNVLEELLKGFDGIKKSDDKVGAVRCAWEDYRGNEPKKIEDSGWAGVMIKTQVINEIGLPKEDFFLYCDDIEYFLRMKKFGYSFYLLPQARYLKRPQDHKVQKKVFGKDTRVYKEDFRLYYAFRNEIFTYFMYNKKRVLRTLFYFVKASLILKNTGKTLAMFEGIMDGFLGKLGKNEKFTAKR